MAGLDREHIREIMEDMFQKLGIHSWKNREAIIFSIRAKYGDSLNLKDTSEIYQEILEKAEEENG
jgi:hypothetical protein